MQPSTRPSQLRKETTQYGQVCTEIRGQAPNTGHTPTGWLYGWGGRGTELKYSLQGSNREPSAYEAHALPTEL